MLSRAYAEQELKAALSDSTLIGVINKDILISDSASAIKIAETILFTSYGKKMIETERPYEVNYIDHYWVINGTKAEISPGGVFLIILDARNCKIIRIIHGK